ncbi:uncharacterized protein LOC107036608 isoform X1 [Diachasma alloeum]|uniref:Odorant receptor n=1 Tax=Diachasma alloeum TaxID=454923 RepID=A0A4E0S3Q5_9HYME|nr:uncharacterized protein LOC107036608 isoform X1 [Diachasma alloeum]THK32965.1 odorant receptor 134 [Diachasma alloeum]
MENIFDSSYYWITKRGLQCIGQWPFRSSKEKRILRCLTFFTITSFLTPTITKCMTSLDDTDVIIESIFIIGLIGLCFTNFFNWIMMEDNMIRLLLTIERDWKNLRDQRDIELLQQHSERGRKLSVVFATFVLVGLLLCFCTPAIPKILDFFHPLNETRPRIFLSPTEYFIDQEKYYIYILFHAYISASIYTSSIVFFENFFGICVNHACGKFEILKAHLESLHLDGTILIEETSLADFYFIKNRIKICSDLQTQTLQFVDCLESSCCGALLLTVGINIGLIVVAGTVAMIKNSEPSESLRTGCIGVDLIFHLFYSSWLGHVLVVQNERVLDAVYQSEWYRFSNRSQLMLLPIMMRSLKPCQLTAGKLYIMSMQGFGAAMRTVISFFTLLNSTR